MAAYFRVNKPYGIMTRSPRNTSLITSRGVPEALARRMIRRALIEFWLRKLLRRPVKAISFVVRRVWREKRRFVSCLRHT